MKKVLAMLLAVAMTACMFTGCGKEDSSAKSSDSDTSGKQQQDVDYSKIKIGMILDNTVTDGGWNEQMNESMERTKSNLGLSADQVITVENVAAGTPELDSTIMQLVNEGCDLIIGSSSGYVNNFNTAAQQFPDTYFLEFEGRQADNYASFTCWDVDAIFLMGYCAALMSEGNELGYVASQPQASVIRSVNAWAAGAKAANPDATVQVLWTNSWWDPAAEKESTNALIQKGITCIGYYGSTTACAQACQEAGCYTTGFSDDLQGQVPESVLFAFYWNWSPIFEQVITDVCSDNWSSETKVAGFAEGTACLTDYNEAIVPQDVMDACDEMREKLLSGEYVVMEGPLSDNQGNTLLDESESFNLQEYTDMYFLLDNVIGELP